MARRDDPFQEIERMFDQFTQFGGGGGLGTASAPVDVVDEGEEFVVTMDLPGYTAEDIEVQLTNARQLQVSAEFERSSDKEGADFVTQERQRQSVSRSVSLPEPVDESGTDARYTNGVLTVRLPKQGMADSGTDIPVN